MSLVSRYWDVSSYWYLYLKSLFYCDANKTTINCSLCHSVQHYPHFAILFTEGWIKRNVKLCATRRVKYNDSSFTVRAVYLRAQSRGFVTKQHIGIEVNKKRVYVLFVTSFPTITIPGFNVTNLA